MIPPRFETSSSGSPSEQSPEVLQLEQLQKSGKWKQAVELAKTLYKKSPTTESEQRLVEAYTGRIQQFQAKGSPEDAQTLVNLVRERFPAYADRLTSLQTQVSAASGKLEQLLAPLAQPDTPADIQQTIESAIRTQVADLRGLATCSALPPDHSLRLAAAATLTALAAVTTGPVTDEQIALPEVSRRSPLAGWKLAIRGIAAYYRQDDDACRKAFDAIAPDALVRRWMAPLIGAINHSPAPVGLIGALQNKISSNDHALMVAMDAFDHAAASSDSHRIVEGAAQAVISACAPVYPDLLPRLRQEIYVRASVMGMASWKLVNALGGLPLDSFFWKYLASSMNGPQHAIYAACCWDRFLAHAVHESLCTRTGIEASMVYFRTALALMPLASQPASVVSDIAANETNHIRDYYVDQPPHIAELAPSSTWTAPTDAAEMFRRAMTLHPTSTGFMKWAEYARNLGGVKAEEAVADFWKDVLPKDPSPLLLLSTYAESRNAFALALKHLNEAEARDPIHPLVRQARLRLTTATTWRHLAAGKPHLVIKDAQELASLPAMAEGDMPGLLSVIHAVCAAMQSDAEGYAKHQLAAEERMGPLVSAETLRAVIDRAKGVPRQFEPISVKKVTAKPQELVEAAVRLFQLGRAAPFITIPKSWHKSIGTLLRRSPDDVSIPQLLVLSQGFVRQSADELAYVATAAGLARSTGATAARFLVTRATSLNDVSPERANQCLRAALVLANEARDSDLIAEIHFLHHSLERQSNRDWERKLPPRVSDQIIAAERRAKTFPKSWRQANLHVVWEDEQPFPSFFNGSGFFDDDIDDDDDFDSFPLPFGSLNSTNWPPLPANVESLLQEAFKKHGRRISPAEMMDIDPAMMQKILEAMSGAADSRTGSTGAGKLFEQVINTLFPQKRDQKR